MSDFIRIWKSVKNSLDHAWRAIAVAACSPEAIVFHTDGVGIPAHWRGVMATEQHCNWCYHTANCPVKKTCSVLIVSAAQNFKAYACL